MGGAVETEPGPEGDRTDAIVLRSSWMPMALGLGVAIAMSPTPLRAGAAAALLLVLRPLVLPRSIAGGFPGVRTAIGFTLGGLFIVAAGAHPASWTFALVPVVCLSLLATTPVPGLSAVLAGLPTCGALWLGGAASSVVAGAGAAIAVTAWISAPLAREFRRRGASAAAQTRELQMVKERFERAFDGISEGYWDHYDLERGLLFLSPRLRELLGYAGDDLESIPHNYRAWTSRIHPEDRGIARAANHAHMANGELYDVVLRLRMKDDSYRYFRHRGKVYRDADGRPLGVAGTIQDVTDRRRQEKELIEAREEALAAARAKSTFLANMSHEIRTPLNGVLGMLQLLAGSDLDEGQRRQVDLAATSAESLINIINDILDVSKVEAGKMVIESVEFELRELLGDICEGLAPIAERKGIHLVLDMSEVRVTSIRSDPVRLRQVLTNLLSNALKFTERGAVEVRATLQGPRLDIEVRDSGIGIPADKLASLFEAFSQADASTTRRFGGTGLGLSITKLICELMQGTVTVESVEGQGSVFRVEVEVDSAHESRDANPWSPDPAPASWVVIAHPRERRAAAAQLRAWGGAVVEFETATDAVQAAAPFPAMLLVDGEMDGGGRALISKLREKGYRGQAAVHLAFAQISTWSDEETALSAPISDHDWRALAGVGATAAVAAVPQRLDGCRVLLVEDLHINQLVATRLLTRYGALVDVAGDGEEALSMLRSGGYDAVLMDCQMPVMDGFAATRAIRAGKAGPEHRAVPIVALTANALVEDRERCTEAGMDGFLSKPFRAEELTVVLAGLIVRSASPSPQTTP